MIKLKKKQKKILTGVLIVGVLAILLYFSTDGIKTFSLATNLQQNYPYPTIVSDNIYSRFIGVKWSNARPDLTFTGDLSGESNIGVSVRTEDLVVIENSKVIDKDVLNIDTSYKTSNVQADNLKCIIDYASSLQREGIVNFISGEATCSTPIEPRTTYAYLKCDINFKVQCLENGIQTTAPYRLMGIDNIQLEVEILKKNIACTQSQMSLCLATELCEANKCNSPFLPPEDEEPLPHPIEQDGKVVGEIIDDELIIDGEKVGDVIDGKVIDEEGKEIGEIIGSTFIPLIKENFIEIILGVIAILVFLILFIFLFRRRR